MVYLPYGSLLPPRSNPRPPVRLFLTILLVANSLQAVADALAVAALEELEDVTRCARTRAQLPTAGETETTYGELTLSSRR